VRGWWRSLRLRIRAAATADDGDIGVLELSEAEKVACANSKTPAELWEP